MRTLLRTALLAAALVCAPAALRAQDASFRVVVNSANPVTTISRDELSRLFLKKVTTWSSGRPVMLVDQAEASPVRRDFTKVVHKKEVSSVKSYWQTMIFAGRAVPPSEKATDADVIAFVGANPNAIGYISAGAPLGAGLRVVTIER
jgi:ABC-type phosphate transport system substrate-binding protein